jgi:hypothetical protein
MLQKVCYIAETEKEYIYTDFNCVINQSERILADGYTFERDKIVISTYSVQQRIYMTSIEGDFSSKYPYSVCDQGGVRTDDFDFYETSEEILNSCDFSNHIKYSSYAPYALALVMGAVALEVFTYEGYFDPMITV